MSESKVEQIILPGWLIPVEPKNTFFEQYGVAIGDGKILDMERNNLLEQRYSNAQVIRLPHHALTPGFVNSHTHAAMNLLKGYADDLPLMTWLEQHIWPAEGKLMSDEFVYHGTRLAIAEMLKGGTTAFNEMYFMPHKAAQATIEAGVTANIGLSVFDFPTPWGKDPDDYIKKGLAVYEKYKNEFGIKFSFAPHAPYTVSDGPLKRLAKLSEQLQLNVHMHVHETAHEVTEAIDKTGLRPMARLKNLGLLTPLFQAVHMTAVNDEDIQLAQEHGVHVMHCPESNMKLASGICPVGKFQDAGVNLAIGTDGSASNNDLDMLSEMKTAALLAKVGSGQADCFSAFDALYVGTLGGAKALGIDQQRGSIEKGKQADLCAIDLNHISTQPVFNPVSQIIYAASREQITHVWANGRIKVDNGELVAMDTEELLSQAKLWKNKLQTMMSEQ